MAYSPQWYYPLEVPSRQRNKNVSLSTSLGLVELGLSHYGENVGSTREFDLDDKFGGAELPFRGIHQCNINKSLSGDSYSSQSRR
jgi:hypothetical protein